VLSDFHYGPRRQRTAAVRLQVLVASRLEAARNQTLRVTSCGLSLATDVEAGGGIEPLRVDG
jgi:hypothetical protein